jgi:hypothetical protein
MQLHRAPFHRAKIGPNFRNRYSDGSRASGPQRSDQPKTEIPCALNCLTGGRSPDPAYSCAESRHRPRGFSKQHGHSENRRLGLGRRHKIVTTRCELGELAGGRIETVSTGQIASRVIARQANSA